MDKNTLLLTPSPHLPPHPPGALLLDSQLAKPNEAWTQRLTRWLQLLALTAPAAFSMGYTYRREYIRGLGLVPADFALTTPEYLYMGLYALASIAQHSIELLITRPTVFIPFALIVFGLPILTVLSYRSTVFVNRKFPEAVRAIRIWLTRIGRRIRDRYTPEAVMGLVAFGTAMLPWLCVIILSLVVLASSMAGLAGRADARQHWYNVRNHPTVLDRFPTVELAGAKGTTTVHVIDAGVSVYMLYDGQRFIALRKELLPTQQGAEPPRRP